jgi:hypothetical protein
MTTIIYCRNSFKNLIQIMVETDKTIPQTGIHMTFHPCIYMIFDTPGMAQALHTWPFISLVWHRHFIHDLLHPWYGTGTLYMTFYTPGMAQALHTWPFTPLVWHRHLIHDLLHPWYGTGTSYMTFYTPGMAQALHTWPFAPLVQAQALHTWPFTPLVWYRHFIHDLLHPWYGTGTSYMTFCTPGMVQALHTWPCTSLLWHRHFHTKWQC